MATLQASLLCKPSLSPVLYPLSFSASSLKRFQSSYCSASYFNQNPLSVSHSFLFSPWGFRNFGYLPRTLSISCTLQPENTNLSQEPSALDSSPVSGIDESKTSSFIGESSVLEPKAGDFSESSGIEVESKVSELGLENGEVDWGGNREKVVESEGKSGVLVGKEGEKSRFPLMVFLVGLWATVRRWFKEVMVWDWLSWWPFWPQEKRLERLIAEADANPKDAAKQSALLAELNKQR